MDVKRYFDYRPELELTAAQIGINKWCWVETDSDDAIKANEIMVHNSFDVLPINSHGTYQSYFKTRAWGSFDQIEQCKISLNETAYYRLSFYDLLMKMKFEKRLYYFLSDSQEVVGLIALNNLNCLAVYNYIYQIVIGIERTAVTYIANIASNEELVKILEETSDKQAKKVLSGYLDARQKNADNTILQHSYLTTIPVYLKYLKHKIGREGRYLYECRTKFGPEKLYTRLRNDVAHPSRLLFTGLASLDEVHELIVDYQIITDNIKST
jgi:hypothetical protein